MNHENHTRYRPCTQKEPRRRRHADGRRAGNAELTDAVLGAPRERRCLCRLCRQHGHGQRPDAAPRPEAVKMARPAAVTNLPKAQAFNYPHFPRFFRFFTVFSGTFGRAPWIPGVQTLKMGERWGKMGKKWVKNEITGVQKTALMHASAHLGGGGGGALTVPDLKALRWKTNKT